MKVVCKRITLPNCATEAKGLTIGKTYSVIDQERYTGFHRDELGEGYTDGLYYELSEMPTIMWASELFEKVQYSDATAEILEKFKRPNETPDKILTPEKVKN